MSDKQIADIARDLVALWKAQKIDGLPRSERNAAIEEIRERLIRAVDVPTLSEGARVGLRYMVKEAPKRGGFMYEGARPAYEAGNYQDDEIAELLAAGAIGPHADPKKGWIVLRPELAE